MMRKWMVMLALLFAVGVAALARAPVLAQEEDYPFVMRLNTPSGTIVDPGMVISNTVTADNFTIRFYSVFPYNDSQDVCFDFIAAGGANGARISSFWRNYAGLRLTFDPNYLANPPNGMLVQDLAITRCYNNSCSDESYTDFEVTAPASTYIDGCGVYYVAGGGYEQSVLNCTFIATGTICYSPGAAATRPPSIYNTYSDPAYWSGTGTASMVWYKKSDTTPNFCNDGTEMLDEPVLLMPSEVENTTAITTTPTAQIRYTLINTSTEAIAGDVVLQNDPSVFLFPFTEDGGTEVFSATVPIYQALPLFKVFGTEDYMAYFQIENTGITPFTLASVCLIAPDIPISECDGIEAVPPEQRPFTVHSGLGSWVSGQIETSYGEFEVEYWLQPMGFNAVGILGANSSNFTFTVSDTPLVSVTIPISGAIMGPNASLIVQNTGVYDFRLLSACIRPATEPIRNCNIINHDFVDGESPWVTFPGSQTWLSGVENGALEIDGITYGTFVTDTEIVGNFRYEARVRAADGTSDVKLWLQEPQADYFTVEISATVGSSWQVIGFDAFLNNPNRPIIQAENGAAEVDWVCIYKTGSNTRFPIPYCESVDFTDHPDFTLLDLSYWIFWLANKFKEVIAWLLCMLWRLLAQIINVLLDVLERIGLSPPLVGEYDLEAWFNWFVEVLTGGFNWFSVNLQAGRLSIRNILEWLAWEIFYPIPQWLASVTSTGWEGLADWILTHVSAFLNLAEPLSVRAIIRDAELFWRAIQEELGLEVQSLLLLLQQTGEVFGVLITGYRASLAGEVSADFGQSLGGLAVYLWAGVRWVDEAIQGTPLTAINLLAMGVISWGLITWTIGKFSRMLSKLG